MPVRLYKNSNNNHNHNDYDFDYDFDLDDNNNGNCFLLTDAKWKKIVKILTDKLINHNVNQNHNQKLDIPFSEIDLDILSCHETICFTKEQLIYFKNILKQVNADDRWYQLINFLKNAQQLIKANKH